jgi:hypothetical protein
MVNERSMLSSSPSKIHEPRVTGVSPRPTDQRQRQKTAKHEGHDPALAWPPHPREVDTYPNRPGRPPIDDI